MVRRVIDFPYTRQYDDSLPFAYHIWQFSVWGVGLPMALLMWAGIGFTAVRAALKRTRPDILILAWFVPFFLITGLAEVKFLRYLLPITPFLAIMAANLWATRPSPDSAPFPTGPQIPIWGRNRRPGTDRLRHRLLLLRLHQRLHRPPPRHPRLGIHPGERSFRTPFSPWSTGRRACQTSIRTAAVTLQLYDADDVPYSIHRPRWFYYYREQGRAPRRRPRQRRLRGLLQQPALRQHPYPPRPLSR